MHAPGRAQPKGYRAGSVNDQVTNERIAASVQQAEPMGVEKCDLAGVGQVIPQAETPWWVRGTRAVKTTAPASA